MTSELYPLLSDVVLRPDTKESLDEIVESFDFKNLYKAHGVKPSVSYLLHGPPGTGKTLSVRAIVNELMMNDYDVLYLPYNIGQFGTAYINMGAVNLNRFFKNGRQAVEQGPVTERTVVEKVGDKTIERTKLVHEKPFDVVVYQFDECDAVMGHRGSSSTHKEDDKLLEELMKQLQTMHDRGDMKELAFFMTNFYEALDQASIRRGRIDKRVEFALPSRVEREALFRLKMENANKNAGYQVFTDSYPVYLGKVTDGFSQADVDSMVDELLRRHVRKYIKDREDVTSARVLTGDVIEEVLAEYKSQKRDAVVRRIGF